MMIGKEIRLGKLFSRRRAFIVALDHGVVMGPMRGIENVQETVSRVIKGDPDALQMTPPTVKLVKDNFLTRNSPLLIARLDTTNVWRKHKEFAEGYHIAGYTVKDAIRYGADAVVTYLVIGYGKDEIEGINIANISNLRREAEDYGIPFIVEPLMVTKENPDSVKETEVLKYVARLASELGADVLKVDYTRNDFSEVVKVSFSPIVIRGGPKTNTEEDFLSMIRDALKAGAMGVTVGRNLWQNPEPPLLASKISKLVHEL
ncbi:aldolase [Sulfolobales archaeon HS-7]|nr:aldolase [Sulfolobales archaeon HS-7]